MNLIELIYFFFGLALVGLGMFIFGYTRQPETNARLRRQIFKKNYGIVELVWKAGFRKRFVHDFSKTIFEYGKGDQKKAFVLSDADISSDGSLPIITFVEDDASPAGWWNSTWIQTHPESITEQKGMRKVAPGILQSQFILVKNLAMARASLEKKNLFLLVLIILGIAGVGLVLSFLAWNNTNEILKTLGVSSKGFDLSAIR